MKIRLKLIDRNKPVPIPGSNKMVEDGAVVENSLYWREMQREGLITITEINNSSPARTTHVRSKSKVVPKLGSKNKGGTE